MSLFLHVSFKKKPETRRRQTNRFSKKSPIALLSKDADFTGHRLQEFRATRRDTREQALVKVAAEPIPVDH